MDACKLLDSLPPILKAFSIPQTKINSYYIRVAEAPTATLLREKDLHAGCMFR
jgi:hypothetical protein